MFLVTSATALLWDGKIDYANTYLCSQKKIHSAGKQFILSLGASTQQRKNTLYMQHNQSVLRNAIVLTGPRMIRELCILTPFVHTWHFLLLQCNSNMRKYWEHCKTSCLLTLPQNWEFLIVKKVRKQKVDKLENCDDRTSFFPQKMLPII